jgi:capsular polysaccharide biosynthesis protein
MEFWVTIVGLLRRKRVIIPTLLVALTLGAVAFLGTPNTYTSSTTMVLTTTEYGGTESQDPTKPTELTNPMLNFDESLKTTSAILIEAMNTKGVAEELGAGGATSVIVNDGRTNPNLIGLNGPFLYIVGQSTSATEAKRIVVQAQKLMQTKLRDWQNALNAPAKTYVSLADVVPPTTPQPQHAAKLGIIAFLFGFLLCVGIAYLGHQLRARRRARAARAAAAGPAPDEDPGQDRTWRPSRSPVLVPQDDEEDDVEPAVPTPLKKAAPAAVPTSVKRHGPSVGPTPLKQHGPSVGPTPLRRPEAAVVPTPLKQPAPAVVPTPLPKAEPAVVPAPVKLKVRYRNR